MRILGFSRKPGLFPCILEGSGLSPKPGLSPCILEGSGLSSDSKPGLSPCILEGSGLSSDSKPGLSPCKGSGISSKPRLFPHRLPTSHHAVLCCLTECTIIAIWFSIDCNLIHHSHDCNVPHLFSWFLSSSVNVCHIAFLKVLFGLDQSFTLTLCISVLGKYSSQASVSGWFCMDVNCDVLTSWLVEVFSDWQPWALNLCNVTDYQTCLATSNVSLNKWSLFNNVKCSTIWLQPFAQI